VQKITQKKEKRETEEHTEMGEEKERGCSAGTFRERNQSMEKKVEEW